MAKTKEAQAMERDFKDYIASQMDKSKGPYACCYCKHGHCDYYSCHRECNKFKEDSTCPDGCDGVNHWEWRGVCEQNDHDA